MYFHVDLKSAGTVKKEVDIFLPGYIPLKLERTYQSINQNVEAFGVGWVHNLDLGLTLDKEKVQLFCGSVLLDTFAVQEDSPQYLSERSSWRIRHTPSTLYLYEAPSLRFVFPKDNLFQGKIKVSRIEDANGNKVQFQYKNGYITEIIDTLGKKIQFDYQLGKISQINIAFKEGSATKVKTLMQYQYNIGGDLEASRNALGETTRYSYQDHLMVSSQNRMGGKCFAQYDKNRRCIRLWLGNGMGHRMLQYDDTRQTVRVLNTAGGQTLYKRPIAESGECLVLQKIYHNGESQGYYYDKAFKLMGFSIEGGLVTMQEAKPGSLKMIDGEDSSIEYNYSELGLTKSVVDTVGNQYQLNFDKKGNLIKLQTPLEKNWHFQRDAQGSLSKLISPKGKQTAFKWSSDGRRLTISDSLGKRYTFSFDAFGYVTQKEDSDGIASTWAYDSLGRVIQWKTRKGTVQYQYDKNGLLTGIIDFTRKKTSIKRDDFGAIQEIKRLDGVSWRIKADGDGNILGLRSNTKQGITYTFSPQGIVQSLVNSVGTKTVLDTTLNLTTIREGEHYIQKQFNVLGQPLTLFKNSEITQERRYFMNGELLSVIGGGNEYTRIYDEEDRINSIYQGKHVLTFAYNSDGFCKQLTLLDKFENLFLLDARNCIEGVAQVVGQERFVYKIQRNSSGDVEKILFPNGQVAQFKYKNAVLLGWALTKDTKTPSDFLKISYHPQGYVKAFKGASNSIQHEYDPAGRVLKTYVGESIRRYAYDGWGRRVKDSTYGTFTYEPDGELIKAGSVQFAYDAVGRRIEKVSKQETLRYNYNDCNQLIGVVANDEEVSYRYDGLGQVSWKKLGEKETEFVWNGEKLVAVLRKENSIYYVWAEDVLLGITVGEAHFSCVCDGEGNPIAFFDETGKKVWELKWLSAFGTFETTSSLEFDVPILWQNKLFCAFSQLYLGEDTALDPDFGVRLVPKEWAKVMGIDAYQFQPTDKQRSAYVSMLLDGCQLPKFNWFNDLPPAWMLENMGEETYLKFDWHAPQQKEYLVAKNLDPEHDPMILEPHQKAMLLQSTRIKKAMKKDASSTVLAIQKNGISEANLLDLALR